MKTTALCFAVAALVSGLVAAIYWFRSAQVKFRALGKIAEAENDYATWMHTFAQWIFDIGDNMRESAKLNKRAAIWTGVSVMLGGVASVLGTLAS